MRPGVGAVNKSFGGAWPITSCRHHPSLVPDGQYRARSLPHDLLRHTSQEHVLQPRTAMGPHHNEVDVAFLREADDGVCRLSARNLGLPHASEGVRHEVAQPSQGALVWITADSSWF